MKLFVDDLRRAPDGWHLAKTNTDAIRLLSQGIVEEISLDHDIYFTPPGDGLVQPCMTSETFRPVAYYIAIMLKRPDKIRFHSGNVGAAENMAEIIGCKFDYSWPEDD